MQVYVPGPPRVPFELRSPAGMREIFGADAPVLQPSVRPVALLREAVERTHQLVEASPLRRRLVEGALSLESYAAAFECFATIHAGLEAAIESTTLHSVRDTWQEELAQTDRFRGLLEAFGDERHAPERARFEAVRLASQLELLSERDPVALLGPLFAFYRLALAYPVARRHFALKLGCLCEVDEVDAGRRAWVSFLDRAEGLCLSQASIARAGKAANEALVGLFRVHTALC